MRKVANPNAVVELKEVKRGAFLSSGLGTLGKKPADSLHERKLGE